MFFKINIVCRFWIFTEGKYWYPGVSPSFFFATVMCCFQEHFFSQHLVSQKSQRFHTPLLSHPKWWRVVQKPALSYLDGSGTDADPRVTNRLLLWEKSFPVNTALGAISEGLHRVTSWGGCWWSHDKAASPAFDLVTNHKPLAGRMCDCRGLATFPLLPWMSSGKHEHNPGVRLQSHVMHPSHVTWQRTGRWNVSVTGDMAHVGENHRKSSASLLSIALSILGFPLPIPVDETPLC